MICQLSITMVFVGLLQALALWALASRWTKISLLYGVLGLGYWLALLLLGKNPTRFAAGDAGRRWHRVLHPVLGLVRHVRRQKPAAQS